MKKSQILFLAVIPAMSFAQNEPIEMGIKFSGFVKYDAFLDSRQTVSAREGHFLLYPVNATPDPDGNDINEGLNFNMLSIQSRLTGKITGPDAFGARTSGLMEADFFGNAGDENGFRLRHAFAKLDWNSTSLQFGQDWNPFFVTSCFPGTISFNTGSPFQPFARNPQIRLTKSLGIHTKLMLAALSQRDFANPGGSIQLRNSGQPDMHIQIHFNKKSDSYEISTGAGMAYKALKPALVTGSNHKNNELITGISAIGFFKYALPQITLKCEAVIGQNMSDVLMMGGYAVQDTIDASRVIFSYTPLSATSLWTDIHTNGEKMQVGVFAGYTISNGARADIRTVPVVAIPYTIGSLMRVSPRIVWISEKMKLATELEYTSAHYASGNPTGTTSEELTGINSRGQVTNARPVANMRLLFSAIYAF